jgi:uncharacterized protein (DUF58 family)
VLAAQDEFFDVRISFGELPRTINWRVSARHDEAQMNISRNAWQMLALSGCGTRDLLYRLIFEYTVTAAALSDAF